METEHRFQLTAEEIAERLAKVPSLDIFRIGIQDGTFIRVSTDHSIYDGMEIKFKSPVDCKEVTKLLVVYQDTENEFNFTDAHGADLGQLDSLFAKDAIVKVILDTDENKAFVQNAATNTYLETQLDGLRTYVDNKIPENGIEEAINNKTIYTNTEPLLNDVGGIKASAHTNGFNNVAIADLITELLYPYTAPVIGTLSLNPGAGVKEKGVSLTVNSASVKVTKKSKPVAKVDLYRDSTLLATSTQEVLSSGTTISFSNLNDILDGNTNTTYYAKVSEVDGTADVVTANATYTFVNPYYCGVITKGLDITEALVTGLAKKIETKGTKNYTFTTTATQCALIAYPASYGVIKNIKDQNGFTQTWTQNTISINGVSYYVYVSSAAAATDFKYTFSY